MTRALVLGSGGLTAIAWEAGVLQGLAEAGESVLDWDVVVGSSAGAVVGARLLAARSAGPLFAEQLSTDPRAIERSAAGVAGRLVVALVRCARLPGLHWVEAVGVLPLALRALVVNAARSGVGELAALGPVLRSRRPGGDPDAAARALGRLARGVRTPERRWVAYWSRVIGDEAWPDTPLIVTAVDIATGARRTIDRSSGVPLPRAVAASTALPSMLPAIDVDGRRCMDGGLRSQTNADLAAGFDEVLVIVPLDRGPLQAELDGLRAAGAAVRVIRPSQAAATAMGRELGRLDPARVPASAEAGRADGRAEAAGRAAAAGVGAPS